MKCEFREIEADSSITVVEHNLPTQVVSDIVMLYYGHENYGGISYINSVLFFRMFDHHQVKISVLE